MTERFKCPPITWQADAGWPPKFFVQKMGQRRYLQIGRKGAAWRFNYMVDAQCEILHCPAAGVHADLVFDHCHAHGWVRAVLCPSHNVRMGTIDAIVREQCGADFSGTPYGVILANCWDCVPPVPTEVAA